MTPEGVLEKLLRVALGNETEVVLPNTVDWRSVFALAYRHSVAAIALDGLCMLRENGAVCQDSSDTGELDSIKYEWYGYVLQVEDLYLQHNKRVGELTNLFTKAGLRSCILKGQSNALLYSVPSHRQCGDIDIWVEGGRNAILSFLRSGYHVGNAVVHHVDVDFFPDVAVEVHYLPAWLYNPVNNRRLQRFFESEANAQFENMTEFGFAVPQSKFNIVFNTIHIYKHLFQSEMTLKNLVDYFYILKNSSEKDRMDAMLILKSVGLGKVVRWLMGKLKKTLGMSEALGLCPASYGRIHRPMGELLCVWPWKIWHFFARKIY